MEKIINDDEKPAGPEYMTQGLSVGAEQTVEGVQKKLRSSRILNMVLGAALVFVGGSYAALIFQPAGQADAQQNQVQAPAEAQAPSDAQETQVDATLLATEEYMTIGDPDAPVTLYEWTDYTCPFCGVFNRETLPVLMEEYVDSGKVRIEIHDVTYIGPQAEDAAVAARAAGLQDRYFDYLFAIYDLGANDNNPDLSQDVLFELAEKIGLDMKQFEADFGGTQLRQKVQESTQLAQALGVAAVPFFVAASTDTLEGLQDIRGAQPLDQFKAFLDEHIARATA